MRIYKAFSVPGFFLNPLKTRKPYEPAWMAFLLFVSFASLARAEAVTLKDCLSEAMAHNPAIEEGQLGVMAGDEEIAGAKGKHLPKISLNADYTHRQDPLPFIPAKSTTIPAHFSDEFASWQAVLSVPLYQGGRIQNGVRLAKIRQVVKENTLALTRNEIIANTVNTFNKLLQMEKLSQASNASVKALSQQRNNVALLYQLGRLPRIDLLKVEVQLANEKQRLSTIDEGLSASRETLAFLLGRSLNSAQSDLEPEGEPAFSHIVCSFDPGWASARKRRPEYRIALKGVEEAKLMARSSLGALLPAVSALGGYLDQTGFEPRHSEENWFGGLNLTIPLFERSLYADLRRDRILAKKAEIHLKAVENRIRLELRNAVDSVARARERVENSKAAVDQARESFRIEGEKYASGAGTMVDLLLAQAADFTASANHTQSIFDYNAAVVEYRRAAGLLEEYLK